MKKIVALVLCLALALSLCTVAFGAYKTENLTTYDNVGTDYTAKLTKFASGDAKLDTFDIYELAVYDEDGTLKESKKYVIAADKASAEAAYVDGKTIVYLAGWSDGLKYSEVATVVDTVKVADAENCGDKFIKGNVTVYVDADKNYYISGASTILSVDGKLLKAAKLNSTTEVLDVTAVPTPRADDTLYTLIHDYKAATAKDAKGKTTVTAVTCANCDAKFTFVVGDLEDAIAAFGKGNYEDGFAVDGLAAGDLVYVATATASTGSSSTTVESAKTFDAGIALYAGMALASVAGSAVVIGKKKEF